MISGDYRLETFPDSGSLRSGHAIGPRGEGRHVWKQRADLISRAAFDEPDKFFGTVKREHGPAAGMGIQSVRELRLDAGGFVGEWERQHVVRQVRSAAPACTFAIGSPLRSACGLRVWPRRAAGFPVAVKQVVGGASRERKFSDRDPRPAEMFIWR